MTEIEMLHEEISKLQNTVAELRRGTVRVETNIAKLKRLKDEVILDVLPKKVIDEAGQHQISSFRLHASSLTAEIFKMRTGHTLESFKKMDSVIFGFPDSEDRLKTYLQIFREVCEFVAAQYSGHWEHTEWVTTGNKRVYRIGDRYFVQDEQKMVHTPIEGV